jgi:beta-galactosidase
MTATRSRFQPLAFLILLISTALASPARDQLVNQDWQFHRDSKSEAGASGLYAGPAWETVSLPHTAQLEDDLATVFHSFQGLVWYKKKFAVPQSWTGKRVVMKFEAAMQKADVWVNGSRRLTHEGGYLPFEVDLTRDVAGAQSVEVELKLDNQDDASFPPGRPQSQLDFTYAGGLYRDVWLEVTAPSHLANVYVVPLAPSRASAKIVVQTQIEEVQPGQKQIVRLFDPSGNLVGSASTTARASNRVTILLNRPKLWDLNAPNLYRAEVGLTNRDRVIDRVKASFGIRRLVFDNQSGFTINGRPVRLEGSNRHMAFPIVGNAASDEAQFREAKKLKSLGLNILRLSHYPQSPAFLDACDRLGILVIDPIPGWQFFQNSPKFKDHVIDDVRQTVLRDRNHPCVAIFETCLNETYNAPDDFWRRCSRTAHETFGQGNFFTGGDSYGKQDYSHPIWDVPWTGWDDGTFTRPALFNMQKGIDREYGDYEFGGEQSTSRVARDGGEGALMLQAWNFIWSHNRNRGNSWSFGDLTWEAIDTDRGMSQASPVSHSGLLDLYRLPKPVAYFYQSQGISQPMVRIANLWSQRPSPTKVVVFSNCDEVELQVNGRTMARQKPDSGPTTGYLGPKVADPLYWAHGKGAIVPATDSSEVIGGAVGALPFSGGNCEYLSHPPFTFDGIPYSPGQLKAIGYRGGKRVASETLYTPGLPRRLEIEVDTQGVPLHADGADFVFVYASVVDEHGQVVPGDSRKIKLSVAGARLLGSNQRSATAGIAPFLVQGGQIPGTVEIEASAPGVASAKVSFHTAPPVNAR